MKPWDRKGQLKFQNKTEATVTYCYSLRKTQKCAKIICLSHSLTTLFVSVLLVCCCDAASADGGSGSSSCAAAELSPPLDGLYKQSKSLKFLLDGWRRVTDAFMGSVCVCSFSSAEVCVSVWGRRSRGSSEEAPRSLLLAQQEQLQLPAGTALVSHAYVKLSSRPEYKNGDSGFLGSTCCKSPIDQ